MSTFADIEERMTGVGRRHPSAMTILPVGSAMSAFRSSIACLHFQPCFKKRRNSLDSAMDFFGSLANPQVKDAAAAADAAADDCICTERRIKG